MRPASTSDHKLRRSRQRSVKRSAPKSATNQLTKATPMVETSDYILPLSIGSDEDKSHVNATKLTHRFPTKVPRSLYSPIGSWNIDGIAMQAPWGPLKEQVASSTGSKTRVRGL